ncbi:SAF domain-containing protein [Filomicrobium sp.]|uniref:NAD(P)H-dependent oxidoreductase n=1 Tax=Filomicrobium sp. TaxID=2024831 RepID=UPI00258BA7A2|nr:SAF domain-containing protein [Filomicrobium sp.]MCV0368307.1 flagellar biosynthesis protein FlgA [Filomicrobium sp.]
MNLSAMLRARADEGRPIRVALIGAGKFGTMYLAQARLTPGVHILGIADLSVTRARQRYAAAGYPGERLTTTSIDDALASGQTYLTDNPDELIEHPAFDVIVEATGDPAVGIATATKAVTQGKDLVMVNVEADALAGPLLADRARRAGLIYSLAWGDQPALICEQVDWARTCGFEVVAAGKGTRYLPSYHSLTPDTVWDVLIQYLPIEDRSHINAQMFNSFLDGTKSAVEMTAVCNACDLLPQSGGLRFPPASRFELAEVLKPRAQGGSLERIGVTEVTSSLNRDGSDVPHHLAMGTFVVITSDSAYSRQCLREYNCLVDSSGDFASLYRPTHMIGLELGISVANVVLRKEPTGTPIVFNSDVVAVAKRDLAAGEILDGEGGFTVWGRQTPADVSLSEGFFPLGLAKGAKLAVPVSEGKALRWQDVEVDETDAAVQTRREMERVFAPNATVS